MKKIIIIGGGVGGLSTAHELSKTGRYSIELYEKKNVVGGLARSSRDADGCATEYCWRVFFNFYHNVFSIMKDIQLEDNKTILNNLNIYKHLNFIDDNFSSIDKLKAFYVILYGLTSCDNRMKDLDSLAWYDALKTTSKSNLFREIGGWLGMDRYKGSFNSVIKVGMEMQIIPSMLDSNYKDYITTKPTSEAWFDPWVKFLINNNVKINYNHTLDDIIIKNNTIDHVIINSKPVKGDYYVISLPIEALNKIVQKNKKLQIGDLNNTQKLTDTCLHMQVSFQVYFDREINLLDKNAFLVVNSPWDLIVLIYDKIYIDTELCNHIPNVKGGWSIAVCTAYIPGILYNKPFYDCTYDEIKNEIWAQLLNSGELMNNIKKYNNFELSDKFIIKWAPMWDTFSSINGKIKTSEPKFTNNIGSLALRPSYKTPFENMYIATAYVKETIDIYSMEGACIAGRRTADDIIRRDYNSEINIKINDRPAIFMPFRILDEIFYKLNLPNLNLSIIILIIIFVIIYYVLKIFKI